MSDITVSVNQQICEICFNRPDKKNALTHQMYDLAGKAIEQAQEDDNVKVVLIKSAGLDFTAGNDLSDFSDPENSEHLAENVRFMQALLHCKLPVVAQVQGKAVGIGTTMLLHCDLVIASNDALFVMPFVNLGLVPEFASSYLLPKLAGHRKAAKWLMLGEALSASEAELYGLVSETTEPDQLEARVANVCTQLAAKGKLCLQHTKKLMKPEQNQIELHMNDELDIFIDLLASPEAQHAFAAFLAKSSK